MPQGHLPMTQTSTQTQLTNNILCILKNKVVTKLTAKPEPSCITNYTQFAEVRDVLSLIKKIEETKCDTRTFNYVFDEVFR